MNIYAKVLADSINSRGVRLTTFEIQLPKVLLAEFNTHRMLSKNFQSSRAMPNGAATEVESFEPLFYGKNQAGMSAKNEEILDVTSAKKLWLDHIEMSKEVSRKLTELGLHKQWSNRANDWHIMAKGIVSGTEWANLLWLRDHDAAQPEFRELAKCIHTCFDQSVPQFLSPGQWHLPYVNSTLQGHTGQIFENDLTLEDALKVSASCCAQVSYRRLDDSVEKALALYDRLVGSDRIHASPLEHQGTPMKQPGFQLPPGITHRDVHGNLWSANFRDWIQHRKLILNEAVW
jgi:thymidylate synthase ThyX